MSDLELTAKYGLYAMAFIAVAYLAGFYIGKALHYLGY